MVINVIDSLPCTEHRVQIQIQIQRKNVQVPNPNLYTFQNPKLDA